MISKETVKIIDDLFCAFFGLFPSSYALFKSIESLNNSKLQWYRAFLNHQIVIDDEINKLIMNAAIKECEILNQPFMPSCGQFIEIFNNIKL